MVGTCWGEERNGEKWWLHVVSKIFKEFLREKHGKNMKELDLRMGTWDLSKKTCVTLEGNRRNTQTQTGDFNNRTRESDMICRIRTKAIEMAPRNRWEIPQVGESLSRIWQMMFPPFQVSGFSMAASGTGSWWLLYKSVADSLQISLKNHREANDLSRKVCAEEDVGLQASAGCGEQPKTTGGRLTSRPEGPGVYREGLGWPGKVWKHVETDLLVQMELRWNMKQYHGIIGL